MIQKAKFGFVEKGNNALDECFKKSQQRSVLTLDLIKYSEPKPTSDITS